MTDTPVEYHRSRYDAPRKKGFMGVSPGTWLISLTIVTILFAVMIFYLQKTKFELRMMDYSDDAVDVEIVEPIPPPPPPPPPPPDTPPPPKLQVRPPVINTNAPPPPITLPIEPTKKEDRVEYTGPPVIVPGPPPPPAPPAPVRPPVVTNPSWSRRPAGEFPERALSRGIESGSVSMECVVNPDGSVSSCTILSETPTGAGFGQAALSGARRARLTPGAVDGVARGGKVRFTTRFAVAAD